MSDRKTLARELYDLERANQTEALTGEAAERWTALARQVFARDKADERRMSSRIGGSAKAKLLVKDKEATFDLVDVSWGGVQIKGRGAAKLSDGAEATLTAVRVGDEWVELSCAFRIVRADKTGTALSLVDLDAPRRQAFFAKAYYPLYLEHLRTLADL